MHGLAIISALILGQSTAPPCPPIPQPLPLIRLLSPDAGARNVATVGTKVILTSIDSTDPAAYPWSWISVELVPESGMLVVGSLPKVLDRATADVLLAPVGLKVTNKATAFSYSVAEFSLGELRKNTNYRILVDIVTPEEPGCTSVHHPGVVGNFTTGS